MSVAEAALTAAGQDRRLLGLARSAIRVSPSSAKIWVPSGSARLDVGAVRARRSLPMPWAPPRPEVLAVAVVDQGIELGIDPRDHMPAAAAVAAVRPAARDVLLAPEADAAVAAVAGAHVDLGLIEEAHGAQDQQGNGAPSPFARARAPIRRQPRGTTDTYERPPRPEPNRT